MATVKQPNYKNTFVMEGNTDDIVTVVLQMARESKKSEVQAWVRQNFEPTYGGLRKLWHWVKDNVKYVEDPDGKQLVKSAARTYHEREKGTDCKSFTIFIVKCLEALNIKYTIRFISQGTSNTPSHVYPVAHLGRKNVIMDAVYNSFNKMPKHNKKFDYSMTSIYKLSGIDDANDLKVRRAVRHFETVTEFIPDSILDNDITRMSEGEFLQYMARPLLSKARHDKRSLFISKTNGMTKPAFIAPRVVGNEAANVAGLRDAVKRFGEKIKKSWRKLVNWIFKEVVEKAAIYFLYLFAETPGPKSAKKKAVQQKIFDAIADFSNCDPKMLLGSIEAKLTKKFGMHPSQYLKGSAIKGVAIGCADGVTTIACIAAAIPPIIAVANKILEFLNKDAGEGDKTDLRGLISKIKQNKPELDELIAESKALFAKKTVDSPEASTDNTNNTVPTVQNPTDSDNTGLMLGLAVGAGILVMSRK